MSFGNSARAERRSVTGLWVGGCGCCHASQKQQTFRMLPAAKPAASRRSFITAAQQPWNFRQALSFQQRRLCCPGARAVSRPQHSRMADAIRIINDLLALHTLRPGSGRAPSECAAEASLICSSRREEALTRELRVVTRWIRASSRRLLHFNRALNSCLRQVSWGRSGQK